MKHKINRILATKPESNPANLPLIKPKEKAQMIETANNRHIMKLTVKTNSIEEPLCYQLLGMDKLAIIVRIPNSENQK